MEIWKTIPDYEDYQVSSLGNVKSLKWGKERILKAGFDRGGYLGVVLSDNKKAKSIKVHKLVAIAFLNHTKNGHVEIVDHINNIKTDNRAENLQLISQRENASKDRKNGASAFVGVHINKKKWSSRITYKNRNISLGVFNSEIEASNSYQKALSELNLGLDLNVIYPKKNRYSIYKGVSFHKKTNKWTARVKGKHIGLFHSEIEAQTACLNYQI
jgi:predicted DNA-binding protein (MmcQ/YjbR family)